MGLHSSAKARYAVMLDLLVLRPRGWGALAIVALVLSFPLPWRWLRTWRKRSTRKRCCRPG
jgi:hypothetical protein